MNNKISKLIYFCCIFFATLIEMQINDLFIFWCNFIFTSNNSHSGKERQSHSRNIGQSLRCFDYLPNINQPSDNSPKKTTGTTVYARPCFRVWLR